jgi:enoyl-[acyl-carrier protein] reductase I
MAYNLLKGKKGIVFGALNSNSIAWKIAERAHDEGAQLVLTNTPLAIRMGDMDELAAKTGSIMVPADATSVADLENLFTKSMEAFGGQVDFVLHSIGMSPNVRKKLPYDDINYDYFSKTLDISAVSFHKMIQVAKKMDAISEWGSIVAVSYIAAQRTLFGYIYGREKHVRINTISQSPTPTTAGQGVKGFSGLMDFTERMSPLGNATADECADYCITLFSDLTKKVTMQNLFHDGGFSSMGMSARAMTQYNKSLECKECRENPYNEDHPQH